MLSSWSRATCRKFISIPLFQTFFTSKYTKTLSCLEEGSEGLCYTSLLSRELVEEKRGGGRLVESRDGISSGETYRAWLIEQHLVRVNERLRRLCLQRATSSPDKAIIAINEENTGRLDYANVIMRIMHFWVMNYCAEELLPHNLLKSESPGSTSRASKPSLNMPHHNESKWRRWPVVNSGESCS